MRRLAPLLIALLLLPAFAVTAQEESAPPTEWTFGWFGAALKDDLTLTQGGARDAEGKIVISPPDRLLKWGDRDLNNLDDFCRALYASKPGELVDIEIERTGDDKKKQTLTVQVKLGDPAEMFKNVYAHRDLRERSYDWRNDSVSARSNSLLRKQANRLFDEHKLQGAWFDLQAAHLRELDLWDSYESTSACKLLLSDPLSAHEFIHESTDGIGNSFRFGDSGFTQLYPHIAKLLDTKPADFDPATVELPKNPETKVEAGTWRSRTAEAYLRQIDSSYDVREADAKAWVELGKQVRAFNYRWRGQKGHEECVDVVHKLRRHNVDHSGVIARLDWVLEEIESLAEGYKKAWDRKESLTVPSVDTTGLSEGDALFFSSPYGLIGIGGEGDNVWHGGGELAPAVILDLGGNDTYIDCACADAGCPVSIVIDRKGNDTYKSTRKWGVGCGMLGTGIIHDYAGNDTYECGEWGIGAAFGGVGFVVDRKGNDRYLGGEHTCGVACYGVGGLIDLAGNDIYDTHIYSLGVGLPNGVGFVLDKGGDDNYRCTGKHGSGYGTEGEFSGWGIGCGFGFRTLAAGGTGIVVDTSGNDLYDAGEFGLGCGYYLGIGMVRDIRGEDVYHSSRYGLATGAHCAVGLFMDDRGHDTYLGKTAASMAGVWDIVTGYFYEGAGNDSYRCDGLGLGASAQNGAGIFFDRQGNDIYRSPNRTIGHGKGTSYGSGRLAENFGIFLDTGGADSYPNHRENNTTTVEDQYGIFVDN